MVTMESTSKSHSSQENGAAFWLLAKCARKLCSGRYNLVDISTEQSSHRGTERTFMICAMRRRLAVAEVLQILFPEDGRMDLEWRRTDLELTWSGTLVQPMRTTPLELQTHARHSHAAVLMKRVASKVVRQVPIRDH